MTDSPQFQVAHNTKHHQDCIPSVSNTVSPEKPVGSNPQHLFSRNSPSSAVKLLGSAIPAWHMHTIPAVLPEVQHLPLGKQGWEFLCWAAVEEGFRSS